MAIMVNNVQHKKLYIIRNIYFKESKILLTTSFRGIELNKLKIKKHKKLFRF